MLGAQKEMVLATRVGVPGKDCAAAALLEATRVRKLSKKKKAKPTIKHSNLISMEKER